MTVRRPNLADLAQFGIHIMNPEQQCCRCKGSLRGHGEGLFADELCRNCDLINIAPRDQRPSYRHRHEAIFYRPRSVYVMHPNTYVSQMQVVWNGILQPMRGVTTWACVVKIDNVLYIGRSRGNYVSLFSGDGTLVRDFGLRLEEPHLTKIYEAQQRA